MIAGLEEFTLAVLGPRWSGKSTFIQGVLDLDNSSISPFPVKQVSLDNVVCLLRFIEVALEDMRVTAECPIEWPAYVQQTKSRVDGAFLLWDVTKINTQGDISETLSKFERTKFQYCACFSNGPSALNPDFLATW